MAILVTCPGCYQRFKVSDQFAGKSGPCPKCKKIIKIPDKSEEVVIEAPPSGPTDSSGRPVLEPLKRTEAKVTSVGIVAIVGICLLIPIVALIIGQTVDLNAEASTRYLVLTIGSLLLGPPVAVAGYTFLRDQELEPYRGLALWIRAGICGVAHASLWLAYWWVCRTLFGTSTPELFYMVFIIPLMVAGGALGSFAAMELEWTSASLHYGMYLVITIVMRLIMGLGAFGPKG